MDFPGTGPDKALVSAHLLKPQMDWLHLREVPDPDCQRMEPDSSHQQVLHQQAEQHPQRATSHLQVWPEVLPLSKALCDQQKFGALQLFFPV